MKEIIQYSWHKNRLFLLLFSALSIWLSPEANAQCPMPLPDEGGWCGTMPNDVREINEDVLICICGGKLYREVEAWVEHVTGFRNNTEDPVLQPYEVPGTRMLNNTCHESNTRATLNYTRHLCPRTGAFIIHVKTTVKKDNAGCKLLDPVETLIPFTISPKTDIPTPLPQFVLACPGYPATVKIPSDPPGQNSAAWYNFPAYNPLDPPTQIAVKQGYDYTTVLADLETKMIYPGYSLKTTVSASDGTRECEIKGLRGTVTMIATNVTALPPPGPIYRPLCTEKADTLRIENFNLMYDGAYWYNEPVGGLPIHDGLAYIRYFSQPITQLWVSGYKNTGTGPTCKKESIRSPVLVVITPDIIYSTLNSALSTVRTRHEINDYRDFQNIDPNVQCSDTSAYYHVLDDPDIKAITETVNAALAQANGVNPFFKLTVGNGAATWEQFGKDDSGAVKWVDNGAAGYPIYTIEDGEKRVCADNLGFPQGTYGERRYRQVYTAQFYIEFLDLNGKTVDKRAVGCGEKPFPIRYKDIKSKPANSGSPIELCIPPLFESLKKFVPDLDEGCQRTEFISACPNEEYTLGPSDAIVLELYDGLLPRALGVPALVDHYEWSPIDGLSNANIRNPKVTYDGLPTNSGQTHRYTLTIYFRDGTVSTFCSFLYKCPACGAVGPVGLGPGSVLPK